MKSKRYSKDKKDKDSNLDKYRELRSKYLKVCRENARLRRELTKWGGWVPEEIEVVVVEEEEEEIVVNKLICPKCKVGELSSIMAGIYKIDKCKECDYKKRCVDGH